MTLKDYLDQDNGIDNAENNKSTKIVENKWNKICDFLIYPLARIVEITKIRFGSHVYIEIKCSSFTCSVKLCITTMWIVLFIIYSKL